jgi:cysteine desulfurase/selenocysteine lyase
VTTEAKKPDLEKVNLERRSTSARPALVADGRLDVDAVRADFPILATKVHGKPLVYLDNAASSQKPRAVIDALRTFYGAEYANIHRGVHYLSEIATDAYEKARATAQRFLNAGEAREIVFVRSTTEGINLIARSFARPSLTPGDEILISEMEHHSNIVPWQLLREETGAVLSVAPVDDTGALVLDEFEKRLTPRTRFVSIAHVSNALGTVNPARRLVEMAHARGIPIHLDGAQAAPHLPIDVRAIGCDFYTFSGHKVFGPTGIGVVYGKAEHLEAMPPYQGGGDMILSVTFDKTTYNRIPHKFEAGTPDIAGAIGLGAALEYVRAIGHEAIAAHEHDLLERASEAVAAVPGARLVGTAPGKASVVSFVLEGVHAHDIGTILDQEGIAIRAGHHCAQPLMHRFGLTATARASFALYNTREEVDALARALRKVAEVFR